MSLMSSVKSELNSFDFRKNRVSIENLDDPFVRFAPEYWSFRSIVLPQVSLEMLTDDDDDELMDIRSDANDFDSERLVNHLKYLSNLIVSNKNSSHLTMITDERSSGLNEISHVNVRYTMLDCFLRLFLQQQFVDK